MNPLEQRLDYKFRNPLLLAEALTHPSLGYETHRHHFDNQRLEFLGDAVLQLIFTEFLFDTFPDLPEGQLTKLRARLVSREGLRVNAEALELGKYLMLGRGEEATGGRNRASSLADAYEALIGALYLDSDYVSVRRIVLTETRERLENLSIEDTESNPKGRLQELLQAIAPQSPVYEIVDQCGPEHMKQFVSRIVWQGHELARGSGLSKKDAEVQAARQALELKSWTTQVLSGDGAAAHENNAANNSPTTPNNIG